MNCKYIHIINVEEKPINESSINKLLPKTWSLRHQHLRKVPKLPKQAPKIPLPANTPKTRRHTIHIPIQSQLLSNPQPKHRRNLPYLPNPAIRFLSQHLPKQHFPLQPNNREEKTPLPARFLLKHQKALNSNLLLPNKALLYKYLKTSIISSTY